jgi:DNA-binding IclR family transcriptional regulator
VNREEADAALMRQHRSTSRVLDVFELIYNLPEVNIGYTLTEIASLLDVPKSSLSPIMQTLLSRGYLAQDPLTARFRIGAMLYTVGNAYVSRGGFNKDVRQVMEGVVHKVSETCHFAELNGGEVYYLLKIDSPEAIRMFSAPGRRLPAYATGLGKALLSNKGREELQKLYPSGLYAVTPHTVTSLDVLERQLEAVRKTGFAFEAEESTLYIRCVAVPILSGAAVRYALSVAVPVFRYSEEKERQICESLKEAKEKIESVLINSHQ